MTVITEITYIVDPVKEWNACNYLEQEAKEARNGWEWEINKTTNIYKFVKRSSLTT